MIPVIVVDTREPDPVTEPRAAFRPFIFRKGERVYLNLVRKKLDSGDYSLPSLEHVVAFERKTLSDLIGTLFGSRTNALGEGVSNLERFRAELARLRSFARKAIVVEAARSDIEGAQYRSRVRPQAVLATLDAIFVDYGIATYWAHDRTGAEHFIGSALTRIAEQHLAIGDAARKAYDRGHAEFLPWLAVKKESAA